MQCNAMQRPCHDAMQCHAHAHAMPCHAMIPGRWGHVMARRSSSLIMDMALLCPPRRAVSWACRSSC
jgi:hypothetical protein